MTQKQLPLILAVPVLLLLAFAPLAFQITAQSTVQDDLFISFRAIGAVRPSGLRYDPTFDRFAWVDEQGQLVIVDAESLATLHVLYPSGAFADFTFSRNGNLLAVALDVRVDVWDVASGVLVAQFEPAGARRVQGPLQFTRDDELLVLDSIVPAPQELRRSENDTVILPWVWDIAAARDQRNSVLVNRAEAYPFYNARVSVMAGDNGVLVTGLDRRVQIYDADTPNLQMIADLPADRLETDPIRAWRSAADPYLYVSLNNSGSVIQVNTLTNETALLNLGASLYADGLARLQAVAFSRALQSIGERGSERTPLARLFYGSDYSAGQESTVSQVTLIDVMIPLGDDPQRDVASDTSLLVYSFNEANGYGSVELLHPAGVNQIALRPNLQQLAIRRQSGEVELYDVASGALVRRFMPSEPDPEGRRSLAYTGDGETLVVDFERYDSANGDRLARAEQYTNPFESYVFNDENQLITFGGSPLNVQGTGRVWRLWDVESGQLIREDSLVVGDGAVLRVSPDRLRYLTQASDTEGGVELAIIDGYANSREIVRIPPLRDASISQIIPNDDWTRFIVVYTGGSYANPIAVYDRNGARLYFDAGNNLPLNPFSYAWRDNRTIAVSAYSGEPSAQSISGLVYDASGLPQCIVDALPTDWQTFVPVWERVVYNNTSAYVNDLAQRLCTALTGEDARNVNAAEGTPAIPANATAVATLLMPSPTVEYRSARTPAPIAVPGVPSCITTMYRSQAAAYADLWRQITANVTDPQQLDEINEMICEGLLSNLGGVQATPTIDPNSLAVTTPTPLPDAPQTTGGDEGAFDVMTIDVETGARALASGYVPPPAAEQIDGIALLTNFYRQQFNVFPNEPVISPDGRYMAARATNGFITIYRLTRTMPELIRDEQNARATSAAQAPRSLGLAPTASQPPQALSDALPTLTPTITITPIPLAQAVVDLPQWGDTQAVCPARHLAQPPDLPEGFAPPGTLIVSPLADTGGILWTLDPISGKLIGNSDLPQCGVTETCSVSPDGKWQVRQQYTPDSSLGDVLVSRIDGTDSVILYSAAEVRSINPSFTWREPHTLLITYSGILPTRSPNPTSLISRYDPETRVRTEGQLQPTTVPLGLLPFEVVSRQPYGTLQLLAEYFSGGTRYYLRDTITQQTQLFAQDIGRWSWQPAGRFLYYQRGGDTYQYDILTQTHAYMGEVPLPDGNWSPDGHLLARWADVSSSDVDDALYRGDLPARLEVWNSDSGLLYTYCLPELSRMWIDGSNAYFDTTLLWSPDSRYLAFIASLPFNGDVTPTPTYAISPEAPPTTGTAIPLEAQYQQQFPRTVVLDTVTGSVVIISSEVTGLLDWIGK